MSLTPRIYFLSTSLPNVIVEIFEALNGKIHLRLYSCLLFLLKEMTKSITVIPVTIFDDAKTETLFRANITHNVSMADCLAFALEDSEAGVSFHQRTQQMLHFTE